MRPGGNREECWRRGRRWPRPESSPDSLFVVIGPENLPETGGSDRPRLLCGEVLGDRILHHAGDRPALPNHQAWRLGLAKWRKTGRTIRTKGICRMRPEMIAIARGFCIC